MNFLPIRFKTILKLKEGSKLNNVSDALNVIEDYLQEEKFNYIKRESDTLIFHKANIWSSLNVKSHLVSGVVIVKQKNNELEITNGNWMVLLVSVPFMILLLLSKTKYSTFDLRDQNILLLFFAVLFIANVLSRFFAHRKFKRKIRQLLSESRD